ncbi:uncharacterized protein BO97DRAFT_428324 [Aspergillus homomorphus CBS 101889]|uniref:Uncharacterized protein n=1 Tax=Aspergillus homomorphus (strain CBS 101889) TaxID=1450537 RepID=A0A395HL55_ASPHC|nr:hypothetical protein BO97DRAFT_428324 [Aspergillus homomorphus CBS 101889]RAL08500.1 hypothetical protein BO97DRAFT_428324 [Aspergillus homomorphus CBS 101889]
MVSQKFKDFQSIYEEMVDDINNAKASLDPVSQHRSDNARELQHHLWYTALDCETEKAITRLVDFMQALAELPKRTVIDRGLAGPSLYTVWKTDFIHVQMIYEDMYGLMEDIEEGDEEEKKEGLNAMIYIAQLTGRRLPTARSNGDADRDAIRPDMSIAIARVFICHAGVTIYSYPYLQNTFYVPRMKEGSRNPWEKRQGPGPLYREAGGKPGYSMERWNLWKRRIVELGVLAFQSIKPSLLRQSPG